MSDKITQLFQQLSRSEKRYLKLYVNRFQTSRGENYRSQIFDLLNKGVSGKDLQALLSPPCSKGRLSVEKNQLYELLLDGLTDYHLKSVRELELHHKLQQLQILWMKGQYQQAQRLIDKTKKSLKQTPNLHELFYLQLLYMEKLLFYKVTPAKKQVEGIKALHEEFEITLKKVDEVNQLTKLIGQMNSIRTQQSTPRNPKLHLLLAPIKEHPLFKIKEGLRSSTYAHLRLIQYRIAQLEGCTEDIQAITIQNVEHYKVDQGENQIKIIHYATAIIIYLESFYYKKEVSAEDWAAFEEKQKDLNELVKKDPLTLDAIVQNYLFYAKVIRLGLARRQKEKEKIKACLIQLSHLSDWEQAILERVKAPTSTQDYFYAYHIEMLIAYLHIGQTEKAWDHKQQLFEQGKSAFETQHWLQILTLSCILHFELEHWQLLPSQLNQLAYQLKKEAFPFRLEKCLIQQLKKLGNAPSEQQKLRVLEKLQKCLNPLKKKREEYIEVFTFDYWQWVDEKLAVFSPAQE